MTSPEQARPEPLAAPPAIGRHLAARVSALGDRLIRLLETRGVGEPTILIGFAALIGVIVGSGILVFYYMIDQASAVAGVVTRWIGDLSGFYALGIVLVLALGLTLVLVIVSILTDGSPGENIPDVMHAVARRGGVIHSLPVFVKTVGAAATIGAGGSVGAEGPVAVLGAALASRAGRFVRFSARRLRVMVGCGAAAGIAGAFGAPLAGVFFALEKLLGESRTTSLAPVVVSCAAAAAVTRNGMGSVPVIAIPRGYGVQEPKDLVLYAVIGLLSGLLAVIYSRTVWRTQDLFSRWKPWVRVAVASVAIGAVASQFEPSLWASGHQRLNLGLVTGTAAWALIAMAFAKLFATAFTFAGGGVGGVFTPALVIGGTFGAGIAATVNLLFPGINLEPIPSGLVGMAAVVSGSMHAPLTAVFMVLEMTNDYGLVLPLLLGSALALVVARSIYPESIYSEWLVRRGEHLSGGMDQMVLGQLTVREAVRRDRPRLSTVTTLDDAITRVSDSGLQLFPVVDSEAVLVGMVGWEKMLQSAREMPGAGSTLIVDLMEPVTEVVALDDTLLTALRRIGLRDVSLIPVIDHPDRRQLIGVISRADVLRSYDREVSG